MMPINNEYVLIFHLDIFVVIQLVCVIIVIISKQQKNINNKQTNKY